MYKFCENSSIFENKRMNSFHRIIWGHRILEQSCFGFKFFLILSNVFLQQKITIVSYLVTLYLLTQIITT